MASLYLRMLFNATKHSIELSIVQVWPEKILPFAPVIDYVVRKAAFSRQ